MGLLDYNTKKTNLLVRDEQSQRYLDEGRAIAQEKLAGVLYPEIYMQDIADDDYIEMGRESLKEKEHGVAGELAAGLGRGALRVAATPAYLADVAGEAVGWKGLERAGEWGAEKVEKFIEESPRLRKSASVSGDIRDNPQLWTDPRWYASIVGEGAPTIASMFIPGMAAAKVARVAGMGGKAVQAARMGGALTAGMGLEAGGAAEDIRQYEKRTGKQVPISKKLKTVTGTGVVAGSLEAIPIFNIFGSKVAKKLIGRIITSMALEGGTEGAQEIVANAFAKVGYDADRDMVGGVIESVVGGVLLGGGMGAMQNTFQERIQKTDSAEVADLLEQAEKETTAAPDEINQVKADIKSGLISEGIKSGDLTSEMMTPVIERIATQDPALAKQLADMFVVKETDLSENERRFKEDPLDAENNAEFLDKYIKKSALSAEKTEVALEEVGVEIAKETGTVYKGEAEGLHYWDVDVGEETPTTIVTKNLDLEELQKKITDTNKAFADEKPVEEVAGEKVEKAEVETKYVYHGTSEGAFRQIRKEGIKGKEGYFSGDEQYALTYAERKGVLKEPRVLRIKKTKDIIPDERISEKGDFKTKREILPEEIEVKVGEKWIPVQEYYDESINVMPIEAAKPLSPKPPEAKPPEAVTEDLEGEGIGEGTSKRPKVEVGGKFYVPENKSSIEITKDYGKGTPKEDYPGMYRMDMSGWVEVTDLETGDKFPITRNDLVELGIEPTKAKKPEKEKVEVTKEDIEAFIKPLHHKYYLEGQNKGIAVEKLNAYGALQINKLVGSKLRANVDMDAVKQYLKEHPTKVEVTKKAGVEVTPEKKEPWQMGENEYVQSRLEDLKGKIKLTGQARNLYLIEWQDKSTVTHQRSVEKAIQEGKLPKPKKEKVEVETTPEGKEISVDLTKKEEAAVTPKQQKEYLLAEIDKAIEAELKTEGFGKGIEDAKELLKRRINPLIQSKTTYKFEVPNDGIFEIAGSALFEFQSRVKSAFPATITSKQFKPTKPAKKAVPTAKYNKIIVVPPKDLKPADIDRIFKEVADTEARDITGAVMLNPFQNWLLSQDITKAVKDKIRSVAGKDYIEEARVKIETQDIEYARSMVEHTRNEYDYLRFYHSEYKTGEKTLKQIAKETGVKRSGNELAEEASEAKSTYYKAVEHLEKLEKPTDVKEPSGVRDEKAFATKEEIDTDAIKERGIKGDALLDVIDIIDEAKSHDKTIEIDKEGYVTLYHRTTKANADNIKKTGYMTTKEPGLFFGSKPTGQIDGYGDTVVKVRIPIEKLELNDIFTNEVHFRLSKAMPGKKYKIEVLDEKAFATKATKPQKTITRKDLRKIFKRMKHIRTGQDSDGNLWFKAEGRPKITIFELDNITGHLNTSAGQIPVGSFLRNTIELKTGGEGHTADIGTAYHEFFHWLSKNGIISANDITALNRTIAKIKGISESAVTEEHRAYYVGDNIFAWETQKNPRIRRILRKLKDFMNAIYDFAAQAGWVKGRERTAENVLSDIESGRILSEKELAGVNQFAQDVAFSLKKAAKKITDNPNFVKWFKDSAVVDENGKPLVCYHGTDRVLTEFDSAYAAQGVFWFSSDKAKIEAGESGAASSKNIVSVYLSAQKLAGWNEYEKYGLQEIREKGFDGIKLDDDYVIFEPTQIKSIFNTGAFSQTDPDIRYSMAGVSAIGAPTGQLVKAQEMLSRMEDIRFKLKGWSGPEIVIAKDGAARKYKIINSKGAYLDRFYTRKEAQAKIDSIAKLAREARGLSKKEVWRETGWIKMKDGWKFEIDDSKSSLNILNIPDGKSTIELSKILNHPRLYVAYPELKGKEVVLDVGDDVMSKGKLIGGKDNFISISGSRETIKGVLLHELQHAIQEIEGFAKGGSPKAMKTMENVAILAKGALAIKKKAISDSISEQKAMSLLKSEGASFTNDMLFSAQGNNIASIRKIAKGWTGLTPQEAYEHLLGEIEARDTEARAKLTPEQRREQMPYESQGIPEDQWIITDGKGTSFSILETKQFATKPTKDYRDMLKRYQVKHTMPLVDETVDKTKIKHFDNLEKTSSQPDWIKDKFGREEKTLKEKIGDNVGAFRKNWQTRLLDRLHPIKALGETAYMLHRLETGAQATMAMFMRHGKLKWEGKALTIDTQKQGFMPWLDSLGDDAQKLFYWMAAKRAEVLETEGREKWLDTDTRKKIFDWVGEKPKSAKSWRILNNQFQDFNKSVLNLAQQSGLINPIKRAAWEQEFYVPFYRIFEDAVAREEFLKGPLMGKKHISAQIKRLLGAEMKIGDPLENVIRNWSHLIHESVRNMARAEAYDYAQKNKIKSSMIGEGDKLMPLIETVKASELNIYRSDKEKRMVYVTKKGDDNVLSFQKNGRRIYFKVNDIEMFNALGDVNHRQFNGFLVRACGQAKRWLTYGATFGPAFKVANMLRDSLHTAIISKSFIPFIDSGKGIVKALREDADYVKFMASGAGFGSSYIRAENPQALAEYINRIVKKEGGGSVQRILDTPKKMLDFWEKLGAASENAARVQLYTKRIAEGETHLKAAFEGRDLMDFTMRGDSQVVQYLIRTVPFMNARAQGLYKLGRAAKQDPKSFMIKGSILTIATLALWAINRDKDEWKELEDWDKRTYYHFWIGSKHYRIPKPFETGAIFSTVFEGMAEVMAGDEEFGYFVDVMKDTFLDTFAMNPLPQAVRPLIEQWSNKSFFTGRPIEGQSLQRLKPGERKTAWTSETMQLAGKLGVSPKRAEEIIRGYFSTFGMFLLGISDIFSYHLADFPVTPTKEINDYPLLGRFIKERVPARHTKYQTKFYEMFREIDQLVATVNNHRRLGNYKEAVILSTKERKTLIKREGLLRIRKELTEINAKLRRTMASRVLTADQKRTKIDWLIERKNKITRNIYERYIE